MKGDEGKIGLPGRLGQPGLLGPKGNKVLHTLSVLGNYHYTYAIQGEKGRKGERGDKGKRGLPATDVSSQSITS